MPKTQRRPNRKAQTKEADRLISLRVRERGHCELWLLNTSLRCAGDFQACHIVGRRYRSTRWDEDNLFCGCQAHHVWFTHRPEAFFLAIEEVYPGLYARLYRKAQEPWDRDLAGVLEKLRDA
jgi:hypothetical protein